MKPRKGEATAVVDAPPDRVFAALLETARRRGAPATITEGAEWVVAGRRRRSGPRRVHVIEYDPGERRLVYRAKAEGDNPSFSVWTWQVDAAGDGARSQVSLAWELRPVTFLRKRVTSLVANRVIKRRIAPRLLAALRRRAVTQPTV